MANFINKIIDLKHHDHLLLACRGGLFGRRRLWPLLSEEELYDLFLAFSAFFLDLSFYEEFFLFRAGLSDYYEELEEDPEEDSEEDESCLFFRG